MRGAVREKRPAVEWPTLGLIAGVYTAFGLTTWLYDSLPLWIFLLLAVYLGGFYGHLQHEVIHGHPTRSRRLNAALVFPSIWLWIPYEIYRSNHLAHHRDRHLTCPEQDPESFYLTPAAWARLGRLGRAYRLAMNSFAGRLLLSPPRSLLLVWSEGAGALLRGDRRALAIWAGHLAAMALPLTWACLVCGVPLWAYLLGFVYGGMALSAMRSFLEHRAAPRVEERICVVESGRFFSFLFLYNNLHIVHHRHPGLAWYRIPARWRAERAAFLAENGGYYYSGYAEVMARYLLWPKEPPVHPGLPAEPAGEGPAPATRPAALAAGDLATQMQ